MRKYIYSFSAALILTAGFSSCVKDKYLNPASQTSLSDATAFDNKTRIENQITGIYSALKSGQLLGGRYFIYQDVKGENFLSNDGNRVTARAAWEFSELASDNEVNNLWASCYTAINRVNIFLEGMAAKGNGVAGADAPRFNAEARLCRAMAYYSLLNVYCYPYANSNGGRPGVPLRLTAIKGSGYNDLKRSTVAEVYAQIIADLNFAEQNLPLTYGTGVANNVARAHRNTAIALKSRVYLSMGSYANVITEANKIVSAAAPFTSATGVPHALSASLPNVFTTYTTTESIFSMPFTTTDPPGTQNQLGFYYMPLGVGGANGIFYLNPAGIIADPSWTAADARRGFILTNGGKQWLSKFASPGPFLDWAPVIRYPEVLLNLSEALARTTGTVDARAVALLNAVRNRADATTTFTTASFANSADLINAILRERNIEFLGEGIRSLDIIRLQQDYPAKSVPGFSVSAIPASSTSYIWPTPSEESRYNSLID